MPEYECIDCHTKFTWQYPKPNRRCLDCSMKRMFTSIDQMQRKEGPFYEKWKERTDEARIQREYWIKCKKDK
jgi:DNA-directed RNA polymerase subunit RPC12/RpoP